MNEKMQKGKIYLFINVFMLIMVILSLVISIGLSGDTKYLMRVFFRGLFGLLILFNSMYLILTNRWSFLTINASKKKRLICGIVLGIVGLICIITSLLGYGLNGDPRILLWK